MSSAGGFPLEPTETFQGRPFMTDDTSSAAVLVTLDVGVLYNTGKFGGRGCGRSAG